MQITIHDIGIEDEDPLILVGLGESADFEGRDFIFQCDLRRNEYPPESNWPEGESYCVTDQDGLLRYGAVKEIELHGKFLRVVFTEGAVRDLQLEEAEFTFSLDVDDFNRDEFCDYMRRILTCGRPEYHPSVMRL